MQKRFHISYHPDYDTALAAKKELQKTQPNNNLQIRKRAKNFELVGRAGSVDIKPPEDTGYTKKKKTKRAWKKSAEAPTFKYEYNNEKARENNTGKWAYRKVELPLSLSRE